MLATDLKPKTALFTDRRLPVLIAGVFFPWITVVLFTAGAWAALHFFVYAVVVLAAGYGILGIALPAATRVENFVLAPALGILAISALCAIWLRLGLPVTWVSILWLALVLLGGIHLWTDRRLWATQKVAYGWSLAVLSALICLVYFLPSARNDAVHRPDGSFNWMYVDTQYSYAIAAGIKGGVSPPVGPGTATEELRYHFGPYAPAAVISRITGLDLGDALARITRGASLWSLVLSCFGVGTLLSIKASGRKFGGIMSVAGLFFYGSLLSLFSNEVNSASHVTGAILFTIPDVGVLADGGPFSHLILGHSMLHGLGAITAIMGLCLAQRYSEASLGWRSAMVAALPAFAIPVNSVAALYSLGVVGILMLWGSLRRVRAWLIIIAIFCLFLTVWKIMGLSHATDAAGFALKTHMAWQWWSLVVGFIVGLGFRIVGFQWIAKPWSDPLSVLVLATFLGLLSFSLMLQIRDGNEHYGIYYLQCLFSIFAFSRLSPEAFGEPERSRCIVEWLRPAKIGMLILTVAGAFIGIAAYATHTHTGIPSFGSKIGVSLFLLFLLTGASALMRRDSRLVTVCSAALTVVLLTGFLAWITPWLNFGLGRMRMGISVPAGEVQGLNRLRVLAAPGERFATNKHSLDSLATSHERSYAYSALSERPVLLEGYLYRGIEALPQFQSLLHDNDLMFSTTNPDTLRRVAGTYHVRWLVARPQTDISLHQPLPDWLVRQQDSGDLKIYRIN
jgi:hypothetical protein